MTRVAWIVVGGAVGVVVILAAALVVVIASGDDEPERAQPVLAPLGGDAEGTEAFRDCLAEQGVELPAPGEGPPTGDVDELQEAFEACRELLPEGFAPQGGGIAPGAPPGF